MSEGGQPIRSLVPRPMFSQQRMYYISGDVIHPQLWESGSGYETSLSGGDKLSCYTGCNFFALYTYKQYRYYLKGLLAVVFLRSFEVFFFNAKRVGFWGSAPGPDGGAYSAPPYPLAGQEGCPPHARKFLHPPP